MENKIKQLKMGVAGAILTIAFYLISVATGLVSPVTLGYNILTDNTGCSSASATTSLSFAATTTVSCGTGNDESMRVFAWLVASSTQSEFSFQIQRSMDNIDWYEDGGSLLSQAANSTTTQLVSNSSLVYYYASSTIESTTNVNFNGHGTTTAKLLSFDIPTMGSKYLRINSYFASSTLSAKGGVHLKLVPSRTSK